MTELLSSDMTNRNQNTISSGNDSRSNSGWVDNDNYTYLKRKASTIFIEIYLINGHIICKSNLQMNKYNVFSLFKAISF